MYLDTKITVFLKKTTEFTGLELHNFFKETIKEIKKTKNKGSNMLNNYEKLLNGILKRRISSKQNKKHKKPAKTLAQRMNKLNELRAKKLQYYYDKKKKTETHNNDLNMDERCDLNVLIKERHHDKNINSAFKTIGVMDNILILLGRDAFIFNKVSKHLFKYTQRYIDCFTDI